MSSYCSVDKALKTLNNFDSKLTIDQLVTRAASKAFLKIFKTKSIDVSRVQSGSVTVIKHAERFTTS